ncbi:MAG: class I SAM-dependent RNA methyltransferase [Chlorobi bacterium]|nr:class I SAM-dependent RNA methyltransferase [Chlorobiota bacterium]
MSDNNDIYEFTAKTFQGLEKISASELKKTGAENIKILKRAVSFTGNKEVMYRANYEVRTVLTVLRKIKEFEAKSSEELYEKAKNTEWDKYLDPEESFSIDKTVYSHIHKHSHFAALKTKDAIADYFTGKYGKRPSVNTKNPDKKIHLHISGTKCTLSSDTSGEPLFKRGYRSASGVAPLNEVLAAGIVMLTDYKDIEYFYDPMCGSGTILTEAARIFMNIPPGYGRKDFAFRKFKDYDYRLWNKIKREADKKIKKEIPVKIIGTDIDENMVKIARKNISNAGLRHFITVKQKNFIGTELKNRKGIIVTNPPYDERIKSSDIYKLYKDTGDTLKKGYKNSTAYIFSGNLKALKHIGLKASQKYRLYNGKIDCRLLKYDLY